MMDSLIEETAEINLNVIIDDVIPVLRGLEDEDVAGAGDPFYTMFWICLMNLRESGFTFEQLMSDIRTEYFGGKEKIVSSSLQ